MVSSMCVYESKISKAFDDYLRNLDAAKQSPDVILSDERAKERYETKLMYDSTEKRSFPDGRWGDIGQKALFLMMLSLNSAIFRVKVGRCPYQSHRLGVFSGESCMLFTSTELLFTI